MLDQDARGFADSVDYKRYGHYLPTPPEGSSILSAYRFGFRDRISTDGSTSYAAESGRYHLYLAVGCPWAQRAAIVIDLLGLDEVISYSTVDDLRDGRGWAFREHRGPDPVNNFSFLRQAYLATSKTFEGHINVPTLFDRNTNRVVNNADDEVFWDLVTQFNEFATNKLNLYPVAERDEIDALDSEIHANVNFGVYTTGLAPEQQAYDAGVMRVFETLDRLEVRLATRRYLLGDSVSETDIRLFVTLVRFDIIYNPLFRINLRRLVDYPNLWAYARDLYSLPAFAKRCDFLSIKASYFKGVVPLNPSRIVPAGPIVDWTEPQRRVDLSRNRNDVKMRGSL